MKSGRGTTRVNKAVFKPADFNELQKHVAKYVDGAHSIVLQAGHFRLFYDSTGNLLQPLIRSELQNSRHVDQAAQEGEFPLLSWRMGLHLLSSLQASQKASMVVVNDWQVGGYTASRSEFYAIHTTLPSVYQEELKAHDNAIQVLTPINKSGLQTGPFFSEQSLRNQYRKNIRRLVNSKMLPPGLSWKREGNRNTVFHLETGRVLYESDRETGCDSEVAAMLQYVGKIRPCNVFIGIYPEDCIKRVLDGISDSYMLYQHGIDTCISFACSTKNVFTELDLIQSGSLTISTRVNDKLL